MVRSELWWRVFFPAWVGEAEAAREAVEDALDGPCVGDTLAVCARACFALRDPRALALAHGAVRRGGAEAGRLRVFLTGVAAPPPAGAPWARAEGWCDRASRALLDGDVAAARAAVEDAMAALPEHAEARRWARFLAGADPLDALRRARSAHPRGAPLDAVALVAVPERGFLAPERWHRRYAVSGPAPLPGSALARLRAAGVAPRLHRASVLQRLGARSPAVEAELLADELASRASEGRRTGLTARALARAVAGAEPQVRAAAASLAARA